ncbi:sulfotransferase [Nonomuraea sp. NPDC049504]|uniref:sulfotransferase family protein n=1 Tax=Nonomuraea sp. NPDC049504 TaxID=3154729 RepID=UPI00341258C4
MKRVQIVGTQRSGSNLLRLVLGSLPGVFAPPSAHKLRDLQGLMPRYGSPLNSKLLVDDMARLVELNALVWPHLADRSRIVLAELQGSTLAHAVLAFYDAHARSLHKDIWVSKCLENAHFFDQIVATDLPMIWVHLVRDPRDVAHSFAKAPIGPKDPRVIALRWLRDQKAAIAARSAIREDRWFTVRYEDLVADPKTALSPLCGSLGLRWSAVALEFHRREEAHNAASLSELWNNLNRPIRRDRVSAYKRSSDIELLMAVEGIDYEIMSMFGYLPERVTAPTVISAHEENDALIRDREMRAAMAASRDPEAEAVHLRRLQFLEGLKTMSSQAVPGGSDVRAVRAESSDRVAGKTAPDQKEQ